MKRLSWLGWFILVCLFVVACQPSLQEVKIEVTRVVTETIEVEEEIVGQVVVETLYEVVTPTPAGEPADMFFQEYGVNPAVSTEEDNLSTFAMDVDTGAYTIMRQYLNIGSLPPADSVRIEEYINYFEQDYAPPAESGFAIHLEAAPAPYGLAGQDYLVRVGIQGYEVAEAARPDALLIFVIDVSGSMAEDHRLGLVKEALYDLVGRLQPTDQVGIVVYGDNARVVLPPTWASAQQEILAAIISLHPEGSTNAEAGLQLAYQLADQYLRPGQINRLILCSDGVANVGNTTAETILEHAQNGISLSTFGFGMGNYNDVLMEQLADQGDGSYAYVDSMDEAQRLFVNDLTGTLLTIARDAKIQVVFDPAGVSQYRLLGYENREIADSDFQNDNVDAGEIGAGHSVTALYEIQLTNNVTPSQPLFTVHLRYTDPQTNQTVELSQSLTLNQFNESFNQSSPRFQLVGMVAEFAEILRGSPWANDHTLEQLADEVQQLAEYFAEDEAVLEFIELVQRATRLSR